MMAVEANFDGLVGPTHNYAGLAYGNVASASNAEQPSNPREAALQGLAKMRALAGWGLAQGIIPPHERPHLPTLRAVGFTGDDAAVLARAAREAPGLLAACASGSAMWTANAATVSPGADTADGRVHFTPANLVGNLHRSLEPATSSRLLQAIFPDPAHFAHHAALPATPAYSDEGAANHTRLCETHGAAGLELFTYGRAGPQDPAPTRFPARQTRAASEAVARLHALDPTRCYFVQQQPAVIDAGVFHNDVIAVGSRNVLLFHEQAYVDSAALRAWIARQWTGRDAPALLEIPADEVSVDEAVRSYLFNSQLLALPDGSIRLVVAQECRELPRVWACIQRLIADDNPIASVEVFDLRQSMRNGGGPACLRLRVVLDAAQQAAVNPGCWIDEARYAALCRWVETHYRDRLVLRDLADPALLQESRSALDALTQLLNLGSVYDFQRA